MSECDTSDVRGQIQDLQDELRRERERYASLEALVCLDHETFADVCASFRREIAELEQQLAAVDSSDEKNSLDPISPEFRRIYDANPLEYERQFIQLHATNSIGLPSLADLAKYSPPEDPEKK